MRKSIIFALVAMLIGIVGCQSICAQSLTYEQEKEIKEQAKKDAKKRGKALDEREMGIFRLWLA
ncbi:MAG: hypothetical protein LIP03_05785 [Bacteroidales bacterium]|nr:hypothetical protein [Bacteroidales bacterium]